MNSFKEELRSLFALPRPREFRRPGEDFGKEAHRLTPVDTAPFYGAKTSGFMLATRDGIGIDTDMRALDPDMNPIDGLFVVGNDSDGYFANMYPNLSTGMACGRTVIFGRHVGKHLASL